MPRPTPRQNVLFVDVAPDLKRALMQVSLLRQMAGAATFRSMSDVVRGVLGAWLTGAQAAAAGEDPERAFGRSYAALWRTLNSATLELPPDAYAIRPPAARGASRPDGSPGATDRLGSNPAGRDPGV